VKKSSTDTRKKTKKKTSEVLLTTHFWSNREMHSYIAITVHFISNEKLQNILSSDYFI